jgi:hypothetical protein
MSTNDQIKRGWKKYREDQDRINQKELDTINDPNTDGMVAGCLALGVTQTDLTGEQVKKIKRKFW